MKLLKAITPCCQMRKFTPLLALNLLLSLLPLPLSPRVKPRIPPLLLCWFWSHRHLCGPKQLINLTYTTHFHSSKIHQIITSSSAAAKLSLSPVPVHPPWLMPSATSAHLPIRKPAAGPTQNFNGPKTTKYALGVRIVHLLMHSEQHFAGIL